MKRIAMLVLLAACGGGGKEATETKDVGGSGYVLDAPKSWKLTEDMEGFWSLEDGRGKSMAQLMSSGGAIATLEELKAGRCGAEGQKDVTAETLPSGAVAVRCKGPSQGIRIEGTEITTVKFRVEASGAAETITCHYESDDAGRADAAFAACKTLRKK